MLLIGPVVPAEAGPSSAARHRPCGREKGQIAGAFKQPLWSASTLDAGLRRHDENQSRSDGSHIQDTREGVRISFGTQVRQLRVESYV